MKRALLLCLVACSEPATPPDRSVEEPGPYNVGTRRMTSGARTLQAFYPTEAAMTGVAIEELEPEPQRTQYAQLLATADPACATRRLEVALDAPNLPDLPLVVASHCHTCTRLSNATTAIRLASHGFLVVSVDHDGATLWDRLAMSQTGLTRAALEARVADVTAAIDAASDAGWDGETAGIFGHSFGAVTAGRATELDPRFTAAAGLAAPMENPLIPGVTLANLEVPLMFLVAREDNSITELGNGFIRDNFDESATESWKLEVADAGHWSVSDVVGLIDGFDPGCGDGLRQDDGSPFTYLDPLIGRAISAAYVTAFFRATLRGDEGARAYLGRGFPDDEIVDVAHHE